MTSKIRVRATWRHSPHLRATPCRVRTAPPKNYREIFQVLREIIPQP